MTAASWGFIAVGAGVALIFLLLVVGSVVLVVHRHEIRELRVTTQQYTELMSQMKDLKNLTLNAIRGRDQLERDVADLKAEVVSINRRMAGLFGVKGDAA